ncbi:MAG: hypothetical protein J6T88_09065 [Bacteroidales bacterium]|nr:hypothetical protein [Bacteroidales bacterium]
MKQTITFILALLMAGAAMAQDDNTYEKQKQQMMERYNQMKGQTRQKYDDARKKANEEYAAFMERAWQRMGVQPAEAKPKEPTPPKPPAPPAPEAKPKT